MTMDHDHKSIEDPGRDRIDPEEVKRYHHIKITFSVVSLAMGIGYLFFILFSGFSQGAAAWAMGVSDRPAPAFLLFVFVLGGIEGVITLPLTFYGGFVVEHRFGLSAQSFGRWCWEQSKGVLVGFVLLTPLLLLFYAFLRMSPEFWWVPVGFVYFLFTVLLAEIGPVLIFPLFYKFSPVEDGALRQGLIRMSERVGLKITGIFKFNLSKNTKKANAAFTGLGRTRRVLLADTLMDAFSTEEIETVIGHELGHYRYGHLWKGLLAGFALSFGGLFLAHSLYRWTMGGFGGVRGDELSVLPLLALFLAGFGLATAPLQNALSRRFERQADRFAVAETGSAEAFISSLEKIGRLNKADPSPHPLVEFFFYSHPPLKKRIEAIRAVGGGV